MEGEKEGGREGEEKDGRERKGRIGGGGKEGGRGGEGREREQGNGKRAHEEEFDASPCFSDQTTSENIMPRSELYYATFGYGAER